MTLKCVRSEIDKISNTKDPLAQAKHVTQLFSELREYLSELSDMRRTIYNDAHDLPRMTWDHLAEEIGMNQKALVKAAAQPGPRTTGNQPWWRRIPEDVQQSAKRGPGGSEAFTPAPEMRAATLKALGDSGDLERPVDLINKVNEILGVQAPLGSMRFALYFLMEKEWVTRQRHGYYQITPKGRQRLQRVIKSASVDPATSRPKLSLA